MPNPRVHAENATDAELAAILEAQANYDPAPMLSPYCIEAAARLRRRQGNRPTTGGNQ